MSVLELNLGYFDGSITYSSTSRVPATYFLCYCLAHQLILFGFDEYFYPCGGDSEDKIWKFCSLVSACIPLYPSSFHFGGCTAIWISPGSDEREFHNLVWS